MLMTMRCCCSLLFNNLLFGIQLFDHQVDPDVGGGVVGGVPDEG
jgi:hypothetical protein